MTIWNMTMARRMMSTDTILSTFRTPSSVMVAAVTLWRVVNLHVVIAGLGEGVDLRTPAVTVISPARDRLALLGRKLVEVGGRLLSLLLAEVGLDPLSSHHDTGLVLLREVNRLRLLMKGGWGGRGGKL